ncbi:hypothetical protein C8T65DRAFT_724399 [Cerioporus squamosus]|nr:hypothetical protein C8T65DRAFT_724399 [Cerioporus squamosus]
MHAALALLGARYRQGRVSVLLAMATPPLPAPIYCRFRRSRQTQLHYAAVMYTTYVFGGGFRPRQAWRLELSSSSREE